MRNLQYHVVTIAGTVAGLSAIAAFLSVVAYLMHSGAI